MNTDGILDILKLGKTTLNVIGISSNQDIEEARAYFIKAVEEDTLDDESVYKIAQIANARKTVKKLKNTLKIHQICDSFLLENNYLPNGKKEKKFDCLDWMDYFDDLCSYVSNEKMQEIWARILTKETIEPGSISKVMLNTFSMLDLQSAKSFEKLCMLTFLYEDKKEEMRYIPLVIFDDILHDIERQDFITDDLKNELFEYSKFVPRQDEIEYLSEIGLVKVTGSDYVTNIYSWGEINAKLSVQDKFFFAKGSYDEEENRFYIDVGQVTYTQVGLSLFKAIHGGKASIPQLFKILQMYLRYQEQ